MGGKAGQPAGPGNPSGNRRARKTIGFGFDPEESPYHFAVTRRAGGNVLIVERFQWGEATDGQHVPESVKAMLTAYLWDRIAEAAAAEFNRRLREAGRRTGAWNKQETLLAPHFGKELTLLAWAVENQDDDPTPIPAIIANWSGLAPEERWWFYTTINATSAHAEHGKDRGWRKAIKIAFAENPIQLPASALLVGPMPERPGKPPRTKDRATRRQDHPSDERATQGRLRLWGSEDEIQ